MDLCAQAQTETVVSLRFQTKSTYPNSSNTPWRTSVRFGAWAPFQLLHTAPRYRSQSGKIKQIVQLVTHTIKLLPQKAYTEKIHLNLINWIIIKRNQPTNIPGYTSCFLSGSSYWNNPEVLTLYIELHIDIVKLGITIAVTNPIRTYQIVLNMIF